MLRLAQPSKRPKITERSTPERSPHHKPHYDTPTKAQVAGALKALEATGQPFSKPEVFEFFGMKKRSGQRLEKALREAREEELNREIFLRSRKRKRDQEKHEEVEASEDGKNHSESEHNGVLRNSDPEGQAAAAVDWNIGRALDFEAEEREDIECMIRAIEEEEHERVARRELEDEDREMEEEEMELPTVDATRRLENSTRRTETRGRHKILTREDVQRMDNLLEYWPEAKQLTWASLREEADIDKRVSARTIRREMQTLNWHMCVACKKGWCSESIAKDRLRYAQIMAQKYPEPSQWKRVRFSDEIHFGFGPSQTMHIIRKPGTRICPECIVHVAPQEEKTVKREHAWAAVGWNFKSDLVWYNAPSPNGKMSHDVYVNQILEPVVKQWLEHGDDFVLEEDGDSGHGGRRGDWDTEAQVAAPRRTRKENIVQEWKRKNHLECYFNCHHSPDWSVIENCWSTPKGAVRKIGHFDSETTRGVAEESWAALSQEQINEWVLSMPQRFDDCIKLEGQMTGW